MRLNGIVAMHAPATLASLLRAMREACGEVHADSGASQVWPGGTLSAPLVSSDGDLCVAFDGRLYNRDELDRASSDAHAILVLYRRLGIEGALARLNGDFALVVVDRRDASLILARDRFGLKPLYYTESSGGIAFSSRPGPLLCLPGVNATPDHRYVAMFAGSHYRYFDNDPGRSPFTGVAQLPAAHWLRWRDGRIMLSRYWALADVADSERGEPELAEEYRALLQDAVARRLRVAPQPGFTLSGGMDSSSVLACAVRSDGVRRHAFSTVYVDKTYDESAEIRSMLDPTVESWHTVTIGQPDVFALVDEMIGHHDEPVATATWLSHYMLCRQAAAEGFGSLFGGLGGDELNAGEYEHFFFFFADLRAAGMEARLADEILMWAHYHDHPIFKKSRALAEQHLARVVDASTPGVCLPDRSRIERYIRALDPGFFDLEAYQPVMEHTFSSYLKNRAWQDMSRETVPCCLRAEDRQTAAFGMENFLPFFDHRLVEFMFRVPSAMKYRGGVTKHLLREAMRGVLPEETRARVKKTGWNAPAHVWFSGAARAPLLDLVHSRSFRERGIYDLAEVDRLFDEHERITAGGLPVDNHMMFFWQLLNLELWLRRVDALSAKR